MKLIRKVKYIIKTSYNIININLTLSKREKHPNEDLISNKKILLLGASIGQYWYINEYFNFIESLAVYRFNKTDALKEYLDSQGLQEKPDAVILKECAAFIHSDSEEFSNKFMNYKKIYKDMIQIVRKNNILPIAATVCPVVYKGNHLDNILKFNDWMRVYAENNELPIIDIEKAVRISVNDRRLREEISQKDGLHLNRKAYEEYLNPLLVEEIINAFKIKKNEG
jgi:hypothetical protein